MPRDPRRVEVQAIRHARGCRSYVVVDPKSRDAAVVDPLLEHVRETLDALAARRAHLRWIVETHAHGDHVSGAAALARRTGAAVVAHPDLESDIVTVRAADGHVLALGEQALVVRHAPGITQNAVVLEGPGAIFTGDVLLIGSVGLRDAPGSDGNAWFDTLHRLFDHRDEAVVLHPGHDDMGRIMTTVRQERIGNRWLRENDRDAFLDLFQADERPACAAADRILEANRRGVERIDREFATAGGFLSPVERIEADLRDRNQPLAPEPEEPAAPSSATGWLLLGGALAAGGVILGWSVHPNLHAISLAAGVLMLGLGLSGVEARRRRRIRRLAREELTYLGAPGGDAVA